MASKQTNDDRPRSYALEENGEKYYVGAQVGNYLGLFRGALYKKYPHLMRRGPTPEEKKFLVEKGFNPNTLSNVLLIKASDEIDAAVEARSKQKESRVDDSAVSLHGNADQGNVVQRSSRKRKSSPSAQRQLRSSAVKPETITISPTSSPPASSGVPEQLLAPGDSASLSGRESGDYLSSVTPGHRPGSGLQRHASSNDSALPPPPPPNLVVAQSVLTQEHFRQCFIYTLEHNQGFVKRLFDLFVNESSKDGTGDSSNV